MDDMIEQQGYPHIPGERGIDFSKVRTGKVITDSGAELDAQIGHGYITLSDATHMLHAEVDDYGVLSCKAFTKDRSTGIRHPDMYATSFMETALSHFEKQGIEISEFRDIWTAGTDTFEKYYRTLEETGSKTEAAYSNFGKPLEKRGFRLVSEVDVREVNYPDTPQANCVYVRFHRDKEADKAAAA